MASPISAVLSLYDSLTAANFPSGSRPSIYLDEAPLYDGGQTRVPFVILRDDGQTPTWSFEADGVYAGGFTLSVYYRTLADCDTALNAILWNGSNPNVKAGLAFATLTITAPTYHQRVMPGKIQRAFAGLDYQGQRVHRATCEFDLMYTIRGTG